MMRANLLASAADGAAGMEAKTMSYTLVGDIERQDETKISAHRSLAAAGRAYQAAHTGNLRRVLDAAGNDVTAAACDAANAKREV